MSISIKNFIKTLLNSEKDFGMSYFSNNLSMLDNILDMKECKNYYNIYAVGGFVMMTNNLRFSSKDIDAFFENSDPILSESIDKVGKITHNSEWMNNNVQTNKYNLEELRELKHLISLNKNNAELYRNYEHFSLYTIPLSIIMISKLLILRSESNDENDVIAIFENYYNGNLQKLKNDIKIYGKQMNNYNLYSDMILNLNILFHEKGYIKDLNYFDDLK